MSVAANEVYVKETARRSVQITVNEGGVFDGSLAVPKTRSIAEFLNGPKPFIEFETVDGECLYISKPAIQSVRVTDYARR